MNPETHIPHWEWYYIAMYFYIGGVSAGAYFTGALEELFGGEKRREISRIAFSIAFWVILAAPVLLIADLGRPERFWHLFFNSKSGVPYINWESPLSVGSWALMVYSGFVLYPIWTTWFPTDVSSSRLLRSSTTACRAKYTR